MSQPICKHRPCTAEVPPERIAVGSPYCSARHREAAKRLRSPSKQRKQREYLAAKPFHQFKAATEYGKRMEVGETTREQHNARVMIAAGAVAYENAKGLIRDVGKPKKPEDAGRVFSKKAEALA